MKRFIIALALLLMVSPVIAEEEKKDNTGTNPINFTNDLRIYHNFSELDTLGDGQVNTSTIQYRTPFADGKWQLQIINGETNSLTNNCSIPVNAAVL